jgi:hypothetical protein
MENNQIELFERFYFRQMDEGDRTAFEEKLNTDESFRTDFNAYVLAKEAIEVKEANLLRAQMDKWESEVRPGSTPTSYLGRRWGLLALLFFIVAVAYFSCPSSEDVNLPIGSDWDAYAEVQLRGIERSESVSNVIQNLNQMYLDKNYTGAESMIRGLADSLRDHPEVELVEGLLMYQSQNFKGAKKKFESLRTHPDASFVVTDAAVYFSLLSKARMGNCLQACQAKLQILSEDNNFLYQHQASLLLERLNARE